MALRFSQLALFISLGGSQVIMLVPIKVSHFCVALNPAVPLGVAIVGLIITVASIQNMRSRRKAISGNSTIGDGQRRPEAGIQRP